MNELAVGERPDVDYATTTVFYAGVIEPQLIPTHDRLRRSDELREIVGPRVPFRRSDERLPIPQPGPGLKVATQRQLNQVKTLGPPKTKTLLHAYRNETSH